MARNLISKLSLEDEMTSATTNEPITDVIDNVSEAEIEVSNIGDDPELNEAEAIEENLVAKAGKLENTINSTDSDEVEKITTLACATEALEYARNRLGIASISITHEDLDIKLKITREGLWKTIWEVLKRFFNAIVVKVKHFLTSISDEDREIEGELRNLKNFKVNRDLELNHALAFRLYNLFITEYDNVIYGLPNDDWKTTINTIASFGKKSSLTRGLVKTSSDICKELSRFDITHLVKSYTEGHRDNIDKTNITKVKDSLGTIYKLLGRIDQDLYIDRANKDTENILYSICGAWRSGPLFTDTVELKIKEEEYPASISDLIEEIIPGRVQYSILARVSLVGYSSVEIENYMKHDGEIVKMSSSDVFSYHKACLDSSAELLKTTKSVNTDLTMITKHLADVNNRLSRLNENSNNLLSETDGEIYKICLALRYAIQTYIGFIVPVIKFTRVLAKELLKRAQLLSSSMDVKA